MTEERIREIVREEIERAITKAAPIIVNTVIGERCYDPRRPRLS